MTDHPPLGRRPYIKGHAGGNPPEAEGAQYANAYLERTSAGTSSSAELARLMEFLRSGDLLRGACIVFHEALRRAAQRPGE